MRLAILALEEVASRTKEAIKEIRLALPGVVAEMINIPDKFTLPALTNEPISTSCGIDSPVITDASIELVPD